jgi:hypothetical protein
VSATLVTGTEQEACSCPDCGQPQLPSVEELREYLRERFASPEAQKALADLAKGNRAMSAEQRNAFWAARLLEAVAEQLGVEPVPQAGGSWRYDFPDRDEAEALLSTAQDTVEELQERLHEAIGVSDLARTKARQELWIRAVETREILDAWTINPSARRPAPSRRPLVPARQGRPRGRRPRSSRVTRAGPSDDPDLDPPPLGRRQPHQALAAVERAWLSILRELHPGVVFSYEGQA